MSRPYYEPNIVRGKAQYDNAPTDLTGPREEEKWNVRLVAHTDLDGWDDAFQVRVRDGMRQLAEHPGRKKRFLPGELSI